ncbi:hypothetical protein B795N_04930 [Marinilactibacillus psychrotolerans]|nr:hypothetical protein B795N_04930 [Marinilactibacillus psychrotolerans]
MIKIDFRKGWQTIKLKILTGLSLLSGLIYLGLYQSVSSTTNRLLFFITLGIIFISLLQIRVELNTHKYLLYLLYLNSVIVILIPVLFYGQELGAMYKLFLSILVIGGIVVDIIWRNKKKE